MILTEGIFRHLNDRLIVRLLSFLPNQGNNLLPDVIMKIPHSTTAMASRLLALCALLFPAVAFALTATPSTTEGPYYTLSSANTLDKTIFTGEAGDNDLLHITSSSTKASGTVMLLSGTLVNTSGTAISGAVLELWVADNNGIYYYVSSSSGTNNYANRDTLFQHFGKCTTSSTGAWSFLAIKPGLYVGRIRHFHIKVKIGGTEYLTTQLMPSDEAAASPSDNVVASLGSNLSLCTYTATSGTVTFNSISYASALSATKQIVVNYAVTAPSIGTQPTAQTVTAGNSATFSVVATGTGTLSYQWYKGTSAISGATSSSYTIASTATTDAGSYYVTVTNAAGTATSNTVALTVNTPAVAPSITTEPVSVSAEVGASASFSVVAGGTAPLTYAWYKGTSAISGATDATYTIPSTTAASAGSYHVVVTNPVNSVTSATVSLTVTEPFSSFVSGLAVADQGASADADNDGFSNIMEFVLGGDPAVADSGIQPTMSYQVVNGSAALVYGFYITSANLGSVTWAVQYGTTLSDTGWDTAVNGTNGVTIATGEAVNGLKQVTVSIPTTETKLFARLLITPP